MNERISDTRKLLAVGMWIATRAAIVAVAYTLLKAGSAIVPYALRIV